MARSKHLLWRLYEVGGIKFKIMGIVLALSVILAPTVILQAKSSLERQAHEQLSRQAVSLGRDVAARSTDLVLTHNLYAVRELMRDTLAHNPNLRYVVVYDPDGTVVDSTFGREFPSDLLTLPDGNADPDPPRLLQGGDELIYDVVVPMFEGRAGFARVGITDRRLTASTWEMIRQMLLETGLITLGAMVGAYGLTLVLSRPLEDVVMAARRVAAGEMTRRARQYADDEIGELAAAFNHMVDSVQRSREELLRRNRDLSVVNRIAEAVTRPLSKGKLVPDIVDEVRTNLGMDRTCLFLMKGQHHDRPDYCSGEPAASPCQARPDLRFDVAQSGRPLLSEETALIPLMAEGRTIGILCGHWAPGERPEGIASDLLAALGRQVGMALENADLWEELKATEAMRAELLTRLISAQEEERKRIAMELHDQTGQLMTSMMVGLKLVERAQSMDQVKERLGDLKSIASMVLDEVHSMAVQLRPPALDDLGLLHALDRHVRDFSSKHAIRVDFRARGFENRRLPTAAGVQLYRIVQEALTNVARHAKAHTVSISLNWNGKFVSAVIHDDGVGFDLPAALDPRSHRLGLFGMQERAKLTGGRLEIRSVPEQGTTVHVHVPAVPVDGEPPEEGEHV